jgi:hypothetical protein
MAARLTPRTAAAVGAVMVLLLVVVCWFLLVSPQRSKASKLGGQIEAAQTQLTLELAEARTLRREAHARSRELATFSKAMPQDLRMSEVLRQLSSASAAAGVHINSIAPGAAAPGAGYNTIPLAVAVQGHYFGLASFLHVLRERADLVGTKARASGRLYRVTNVQFSGDGTGTGNVQATMTIDTFTSAAAPAASTTVGSTSDSSTGPSSAPATAP